MELSKQVVSSELAKRLKELGVKQESLFYWTTGGVVYRSEMPFWLESNYSAFTVTELGEMLPVTCTSAKRSSEWVCHYFSNDDTKKSFIAETEANARAKCLIMLREIN